MVGGRSLAMGLNRLIDAEIDSRNPRTQKRELPAGLLPDTRPAYRALKIKKKIPAREGRHRRISNIGTVPASAKGEISRTVIVPFIIATGSHTITAKGQTSGLTAKGPLVISAPTFTGRVLLSVTSKKPTVTQTAKTLLRVVTLLKSFASN